MGAEQSTSTSGGGIVGACCGLSRGANNRDGGNSGNSLQHLTDEHLHKMLRKMSSQDARTQESLDRSPRKGTKKKKKRRRRSTKNHTRKENKARTRHMSLLDTFDFYYDESDDRDNSSSPPSDWEEEEEEGDEEVGNMDEFRKPQDSRHPASPRSTVVSSAWSGGAAWLEKRQQAKAAALLEALCSDSTLDIDSIGAMASPTEREGAAGAGAGAGGAHTAVDTEEDTAVRAHPSLCRFVDDTNTFATPRGSEFQAMLDDADGAIAATRKWREQLGQLMTPPHHPPAARGGTEGDSGGRSAGGDAGEGTTRQPLGKVARDPSGGGGEGQNRLVSNSVYCDQTDTVCFTFETASTRSSFSSDGSDGSDGSGGSEGSAGSEGSDGSVQSTSPRTVDRLIDETDELLRESLRFTANVNSAQSVDVDGGGRVAEMWRARAGEGVGGGAGEGASEWGGETEVLAPRSLLASPETQASREQAMQDAIMFAECDKELVRSTTFNNVGQESGVAERGRWAHIMPHRH
jgi:hypothetical protein